MRLLSRGAGALAAESRLDQEATPAGDFSVAIVPQDFVPGQTFTAGISGSLGRTSLSLARIRYREPDGRDLRDGRRVSDRLAARYHHRPGEQRERRKETKRRGWTRPSSLTSRTVADFEFVSGIEYAGEPKTPALG